ncbi:putative membrane protein DUF2157 [Anaerobacterium chartisolvens]|uniref:Putative membrane protein DUF2157 n=1 Tax=Anaerobacterium chartisolvens TaxID=1297424 RepID=A0A369AWW1_9FIRM|nr:DUF2157 domain-containing protein [Anaerobacterium chartisolvens]RCX13872.1 putative membrane protein DUF2157 [Anaerobacterium chartisolvens]
MKSPEERITELEQRVAYLENITRRAAAEKPKTVRQETRRPETGRNVLAESRAMNTKPAGFPPNPQREKERGAEGQDSRGKDKEALVGKYLIGALAALLIFIGAISFIGLIWNTITPLIKLLIISLAGIILTAVGFWLIRTKKNAITSIILGTGAGLVFIAILSANLAFHLIGNNVSILLAGIWAVFFILSSRYTNMFFTTVIAYIGSYIALLLGLGLMQGDMELLVMIIFATGISSVMIYKTFNSNRTELIVSILLSILNYASILIRCYFDGLFGARQLLESCFGQSVVIIILYVLMNMFYNIIGKKDAFPAYIGISAVTTILTILFIANLNDNYLHTSAAVCYILFFIINLIQFVLNNVFYKTIEKWLTRYYAVILAITAMLINIELFKVPTGIIIAALLLAVSGKVFKLERQLLLTALIILLDSLFLIFSHSGNLICSVYGIIQLGLMVYVLRECVSLRKYSHITVLKIIGIAVILMNSFGIPSNIVNFINVPYLSKYTDNAAGYLISVAAVIALLKIGYFKNWKSEQFKFFGANDTIEDDKNMQTLVYLFSTALYFYGLQGIAFADSVVLQLIFVLAATAITLIQSRTILSGNLRNKTLMGIWIIIKYLILTWTILWSFSDLNGISAAYSLAGLIVAIVSILVGFKLGNKSIRQYGLVLTIVMVAKFIFVDLIEENSITRVIALIAGGGLCFLISLIYNKLSRSYS